MCCGTLASKSFFTVYSVCVLLLLSTLPFVYLYLVVHPFFSAYGLHTARKHHATDQAQMVRWPMRMDTMTARTKVRLHSNSDIGMEMNHICYSY